MAKRRKASKSNGIKALNYTYQGLRAIGMFFWLSVKYQYLGIKSIVNQIQALTRKDTVASVKDGSPADASQSSLPHASKKQKSTIKTLPAFVPFEQISTAKGTFESFTERVNKGSSIILVAGRRGSGKSVLGFRMMENIHAQTKRPVYVLGVKQSVLPQWIESVDQMEQVKNGGVVLVDEGAIAFGSRNAMSKKNKELGNLMAIARHKDLTLILITQNTGMIDKNVLNLTDTVMLKEGSLLQEKMERSVMKEMYTTANKAIAGVDDKISHVYIVDTDFEGLVKVSLPSFWSSNVSKNRA
jgi:hypothetical protein